MDFIKFLKENYKIDLNIKQQEAVLNINGPFLLLSVPGGGKTTVIVSRCANMILNHGISTENILTLTFSRASAKDMKIRYGNLFGKENKKTPTFSTIHSFCYSAMDRYLKLNNKPTPLIIEDDKAEMTKSKLLKKIYFDIHKEYIGEDRLEELSNNISYVKNMLINVNDIKENDFSVPAFKEVFEIYEKTKRNNRYIDYDDMLTGVYQLFTRYPEFLKMFQEKYHYINVDESQDTSFVQHEIIRLLAKPKNNIFMVGDEDQSIYSFRAAFPKALLDFGKIYPGAKILMMEQNYRATGKNVEAASAFIQQNRERYPKSMFTERESGEDIAFCHFNDKKSSLRYLSDRLKNDKEHKSRAVIFRNNISAVAVAFLLRKDNVPFYLRESNIHFFNHWIVKDITTFMKMSMDLTNIEIFEQIYYKMDGYISKSTLQSVMLKKAEGESVFKALSECISIYDSAQKSIRKLNKNFQTLAKLNSIDAIEFIQTEMGYGKYLKRLSKENGYSHEGINQVIDALKIIAEQITDYNSLFSELINFRNFIEGSRWNTNKEAVVLSTIHGCKGLEFDKVYMIDLIEGVFPSSKSIGESMNRNWSSMEEEVRLFYVGITRAKNNLELITFDKVNDRRVKSSRFVRQLKSGKTRTVKKEMKIGSMIEHNKFGEGEIISIEDDMFEVSFEKFGRKMFSLKTCIESGAVKFLKRVLKGSE